MSALTMLRPMEQEYLRRNPGVTVTNRTWSGEQYIPPGHPFSQVGAALGRQALAAGVLDEGARQPQFGSMNALRSVSVTKSERLNKLQKEQKQEPKKAEPKKAEPAPQMEGRVATVNRTKQSRGRTILDPLATKDSGQTYKKRLLGG